MGTIRLTLQTNKKNTIGKAPVLLIYQVSGVRKYLGTGVTLFADNWDEDLQQAKFFPEAKLKKSHPQAKAFDLPTSDDIRLINADLLKLVRRVKDSESRLKLDGIAFTAAMVIEPMQKAAIGKPKKINEENLIPAYIDRHIKERKELLVPGSLSVYRALKRHLIDFEKYSGSKPCFSEIDSSYLNRFYSYLVSRPKKRGSDELGLNNTTAAKQVTTLKTFLNKAKGDGIKVSDRYKDFRIKRDKLEVIALTDNEFRTLFNLDLSENKALDKVRDVFCFSCVTGLRYSDLAQLKREHIKTNVIKIRVRKTRTELSIPLNPYAVSIINKYKNYLNPLPIISNQKTNKHIKDLCKIAGICEPIEKVRYKGAKSITVTKPKYEFISCHSGRKSFVTISLARGMSAEEVMKITGHESYESFKRYTNITEERKIESMQKAWGEIERPKPSKLAIA
jgi:integrase